MASYSDHATTPDDPYQLSATPGGGSAAGPAAAGLASAKGGAKARPRIVLMGNARSGKTSIQKVVFNKMSPHETLFLEPTREPETSIISNSHFCRLEICDFPSTLDDTGDALDGVFDGCSALVFVVDAQDAPHSDALARLQRTARVAYDANPGINIEVFIHKVDGLSDDLKGETQREIHAEVSDELLDAGMEDCHVSFHLTSIYDHSVFEAFSKVVQKMMPEEVSLLENLLDSLLASCRIEKAFLFDVVSKIYVATDSSPVDMQSYELCSDMIDVVIDVSCIYGMTESSDALAYDAKSFSAIKLSNGMVLCLREVNHYLALVCLVREENFAVEICEFNFAVLRAALDARVAE